MTAKEKCYNLIDSFSDKKISLIMNYFNDIQRIKDTELEEILDDDFCIKLAERYDKLKDKNDKGKSIEELAEKWGINLNED